MRSAGPFSTEQRLELIRRQFLPGQVFYLFCEFTWPPKEKFVVLACVNPRPLVLLINTNKSELAQSDPDLDGTQVCIKPSDYGCLTHDSYIDCLECFDMEQDEIER